VNIDLEFTKWLATLGIGGVLAAFMFTFYRKDVKQYTELWKNTTELVIAAIKENTASNVKLIVMLEQQERNAIRKEDIENLINRKFVEKGLP
jgi:transcriptional/translational regulatory protein YebC/TACO1